MIHWPSFFATAAVFIYLGCIAVAGAKGWGWLVVALIAMGMFAWLYALIWMTLN